MRSRLFFGGLSSRVHQSYQNGVLFPVQNFGTLESRSVTDVFDFGKRRERDSAARSGVGRSCSLSPASCCKARAELPQAQLTCILAQAQLEQTIGRIPGQ
jgi:hypothetical protein